MPISDHNNNILIQTLSAAAMFLFSFLFITDRQKPQTNFAQQKQVPTATIIDPFPYVPPKIPYSRAYITMLVGDSMVASLGPNANLLRQHLIEYYPEHEFVNYNYGFGSTNIETLPERLMKDTLFKEQNFPSILSQGFDLIIIESFAYNPLSKLSEGEDVSRHIQILDESIRQIIQTRPQSTVCIMATIAPNKTYYAKGIYKLSAEERLKWVQERISYFEAVTKYAEEKEIPLINVYEKSLNAAGDGDLKYINPDDYIHPSAQGIDLISKTIAEFIFNNKLFPQ